MGTKSLIALSVFLMMQPLLAETERSKAQLFNQLSRAGYDHVVEIPYHNFWNTRGSHPYMVDTSRSCLHRNKISFGDLPQQRLPAMSYKSKQSSDGRMNEWMRATRIGDFLVCFKKFTQVYDGSGPGSANQSREPLEHENSTFNSCFIFPVEVDQVIAELESIGDDDA